MSSQQDQAAVQEVSDRYVAIHQGGLLSETDIPRQYGLELYPYSFPW